MEATDAGDRCVQHLFTGGTKSVTHPRPGDIDVRDVAHGLAAEVRFNGQTRRYLTVAEHSWHVSRVGPAETALERLMHDAPEGYIKDMIRPMKRLAGMSSAYGPIEARHDAAIAARFHLGDVHAASRDADLAVWGAEYHDEVRHDAGGREDVTVVADVAVGAWPPAEAEARFLDRFDELYAERLSALVLPHEWGTSDGRPARRGVAARWPSPSGEVFGSVARHGAWRASVPSRFACGAGVFWTSADALAWALAARRDERARNVALGATCALARMGRVVEVAGAAGGVVALMTVAPDRHAVVADAGRPECLGEWGDLDGARAALSAASS